MKKWLALICVVVMCTGLFLYNFHYDPTTGQPVNWASPPPKPEGKVVYINPDPALQEAWETIAKVYTEKTGVSVAIIPQDKAEGVTPTLFTVRDAAELATVSDVCLDLSTSYPVRHLKNWDLALKSGDKLCGLPAQVEGYGLIYNGQLLRQYGLTASNITSFAKLQEAVQHIPTGKKLFAFACNDMSDTGLALLAAMPGDIRNFWDLYSANKATGTNAQQLMADNKAVFCIGSTQEFAQMSTMKEDNLNIMPLYIGMEGENKQGLCVQVEYYWCVRKDVPQADQEATLDFFHYLLHTDADGKVPIDALEILLPYINTTYSGSPLDDTFRRHIKDGKNLVLLSNLQVPAGLTEALAAYSADPTDENWAFVAEILQ